MMNNQVLATDQILTCCMNIFMKHSSIFRNRQETDDVNKY